MTNDLEVVAISIESGDVLWASGPYSAKSAEAVIKMSIARQGVLDRFYTVAAYGKNETGKPFQE